MQTSKEDLQKIAHSIMDIDHYGCQADNIHKCEQKHRAIISLDKLDKHEAVRLLMHVIEVQQLRLINVDITPDPKNPFVDMQEFRNIDIYVQKCNSPTMETLY
jgi:hypothetical protein